MCTFDISSTDCRIMTMAVRTGIQPKLLNTSENIPAGHGYIQYTTGKVAWTKTRPGDLSFAVACPQVCAWHIGLLPATLCLGILICCLGIC